jgi:transcription elongation GreA/GreB family factor
MTDQAIAPFRSPQAHAMTSGAWQSLEAEIERLADAVRRGDARVGAAPGATDAWIVELPEPDALRRLGSLQAVAERAVVDDEGGVAVIGRRVTVRDPDGVEATYSLVLPGDGDPIQGWISSDSPLGAAVTGRRAGDEIEVVAPAGSWRAMLVDVA